jgi:hypothetical protein
MNGTNIQDFNQDGYPDILIAGNNFGNEQHSGRYDASNGLLLINDQEGGFVASWNSGFLVPGDGKALVSFVDSRGELSLMASQNQGKLKGFRSGIKAEVPPNGSKKVRFKVKGKESVRELYMGSSYLSQSGKGVVLPFGASDIRWE